MKTNTHEGMDYLGGKGLLSSLLARDLRVYTAKPYPDQTPMS